MKQLVRLMTIAFLGLILSLSLHLVLPIKAQQVNQFSALEWVQKGQKHYNLGEFTEAVQALQQAAKIFENQGDSLKQIQSLSLLSLALQKLGQWKEAEATVNLSLSLLETLPKTQEKLSVRAQVLNNKAHGLLATGQSETALLTWQEAETLYQQVGDEIGVMGSQINQGEAWETLGFFRRSCNTLLQAFKLKNYKCEDLTPDTLKSALETNPQFPNSLHIIAWRSLGNVLRLLGKLEESIPALNQSLTLAQQLHYPQEETKTLLSLGNTQQALASKARDLEKEQLAQKYTQSALNYYQQAFIIAQSSHHSSPLDQIQIKLNQINILSHREQGSEMQSLFSQISQEIANLPPSRVIVYAKVKLAQNLAHYSLKQSQDFLESALADARKIEDKRAESYALGNLGKLQYDYQLSPLETTQILLQKALTLAKSENSPEMAYQWQWQLGRIYQKNKETQKAIAAYTTAFETLQELRSDLMGLNQDIQFSFREQVEPVYRELAQLLLQHQPGEIQPNQENLKQARQIIEALQLAQLDNYFQDACTNLKAQDIEKIDPHAALIYTIILPERLEVILSLPDGRLKLQTNYISQPEVEKTLAQLQSYLKEPDRLRDVQALSQQVYNWLIASFEKEIELEVNPSQSQIKTLVFVLDGSLQNIPMAVLYNGKQYLAQRYATALTPGLQLLEPLPLPQQLKTLIAGVSEERRFGTQEFTAIENVETEWKTISKIVPSETLLNANFTKTNLQEQIQNNPFSIVHFATHGQFSSDPEETFILLWNQLLNVKELDNLLQSRNEANSRLIDLLVLSACETATGDKRATLGLAGVAVRAGARSTVATLWQVNDESTATFMGNFYQILTENPTITKAEALRRAQLQLWENIDKDWQVPSFWSPYVLVGNWL